MVRPAMAWASVTGSGRPDALSAPVFAADREKRVLFNHKFPEKISGTVTAANGVIYLATMTDLYALAER